MLQRFEGILAERAELGGLVLRIILGGVFVAHGYLAAFVYTPAGMTQFFASVGIPLPALNAWVVILVHFAGGGMILLGLFTRLNALVHAFLMLVATLAVHIGQGFFLSVLVVDAASNTAVVAGFEYALVLAVASFSLAFTGPGALALDNLLDKGIVSSSSARKAGAAAHS